MGPGGPEQAQGPPALAPHPGSLAWPTYSWWWWGRWCASSTSLPT